MNNIFKFALGILSTLVFAWLAFVAGARAQFGDLEPTSSILMKTDLYPKTLICIQNHFLNCSTDEEYVSLGC